MAKKTAKAAPVFDLDRLEKQVGKARARAENIAKRTWNDTLDLLPTSQRKAIRNATARIERATRDLQRRSEKAVKDINARGKKIMAEIERRAATAAKPIIERLDVATRADVERLSKRVTQIERKLHQEVRRVPA
jgi:hypothetical protein